MTLREAISSMPASATAVTRPEAPRPQPPEELIATCQGLVRSLAWKISKSVPRTIELDDLIGYGQIGLAQAARDYDPARGQFTTYAYYRIRGAILDGLSKLTWFSLRQFHGHVYEQAACDALDADEQALAEAGTPLEPLTQIQQSSASVCISYLFSHLAQDEGVLGQVIQSGRTTAPEADLESSEIFARLRQVIDMLPEEPRRLITNVYFEGISLEEAGRRLGKSKSWASRLHARTLQAVAASLRRHGIQEAVSL